MLSEAVRRYESLASKPRFDLTQMDKAVGSIPADLEEQLRRSIGAAHDDATVAKAPASSPSKLSRQLSETSLRSPKKPKRNEDHDARPLVPAKPTAARTRSPTTKQDVRTRVESLLADWHDPTLPSIGRLPTGTSDVLPAHSHDRTAAVDMIPVDREALTDADYLGQYDRKFLLCRHRRDSQDLLLLVDQHAADERIRVERFIDELTGEALRVDVVDISVELNEEELSYLPSVLPSMAAWGIEMEMTEGGSVKVVSLPRLISTRCRMEPELVSRMVKQHLAMAQVDSSFCSASRRNIGSCPRVLSDLLNGKACRGAFFVQVPARDTDA